MNMRMVALAWVALTAIELSGAAYDVRVRGLGAFDLECDDGSVRRVSLGLAKRGGPGGPGTQGDEHRFVKYSARVKLIRRGERDKLPPVDVYSNCVVSVESKDIGLDLTYYLLPHFNMSKGLYGHRDVVASMPAWRAAFPLAPERAYDFRFVAEPGRTLVYLDGSLAAVTTNAFAVKEARVASSRRRNPAAGLEIVRQGPVELRAAEGQYELPPIPYRTNRWLQKGAKLSIPAGERTVGGVPLTVWEPAQAIDQGEHRQTTDGRDLVWNPLNERTPWASGPEFFQWRVPARAWLKAHVLCADVPQPGREPVVGTCLAVFGRGCTAGNIDFETLSLHDPAARDRIRQVGTLQYVRDGRSVTTPLYLVTLRLEASTLGRRGEEAAAMDFEFVGAGRPARYPRSSVQVFGCTLEEAPYSFRIDNPVRGNIFEQGTDRQASAFEVISRRANVRGSVEVSVFDPLFRPLRKFQRDFAFAEPGEKRRIELDLSAFDVGWYGMDMTFRDARGASVATHSSSFTVLHADDREAGYESPFAAWPLLNGKHGANTNRFEQLEVMRKAGYRTTWQPPCTNEAEGARWKVTKSTAGQGFYNPPPPMKSPEELTAHLDRAVAEMRADFAAFPHCRFIQLLHETGGKEISAEVRDGVKGKVGPYRGWCDDWTAPENKDAWVVYYCTEYARRMRREFPDKKIFLGNGSSSCERIAALCRAGFDLGLVDELGIESKGFSTMPEFSSNQEAPGMLWALRETGRAFGYDHLGLNACNEYVFRPERTVKREWTPRRILQVADYSARDYIISLAHGCSIISSGHLEDCNDSYYETNWGAGGQCTFYPFSYPKRVFTALAVLTRALDKATYVRRVPTGEITSYALEFRRDRRRRDFAYALWTPRYGATLAFRFPAGETPTLIGQFGAERTLRPDAKGEVAVEIGSSPVYLIATQAARSARVVAHAVDEPAAGARVVARLKAAEVAVSPKDLGRYGNAWGMPKPLPGTFELRDVADPAHGSALEVKLVRAGEVPAIRSESTTLLLRSPIRIELAKTGRFGVWVRGNGAFAKFQLVLRDVGGKGRTQSVDMGDDRGFIAFDGWQYLSFDVLKNEKGRPRDWKGAEAIEVIAVVCGSARQALDPIEMTEVTQELAIGPFVATPAAGGAATSQVDKDEAHDAMDTVDEKDL